MTSQLKGAVVLVTGATGQVGWGVAKAAEAAGAKLVLPLRSRRSEVEQAFDGADVMVEQVDLLDESDVVSFRSRIRDRFGRLDHVVAPLGGWWQKGATIEQERSDLRSLLEVYVEAQQVLVKAMAPLLRSSGGSYTLVTGAAGERVIPGAGLLVAAVAAQFGLSRVLRAELASEPFRFNELRIACRVERESRPGVISAIAAGRAFLEIMTSNHHTGSGCVDPGTDHWWLVLSTGGKVLPLKLIDESQLARLRLAVWHPPFPTRYRTASSDVKSEPLTPEDGPRLGLAPGMRVRLAGITTPFAFSGGPFVGGRTGQLPGLVSDAVALAH